MPTWRAFAQSGKRTGRAAAKKRIWPCAHEVRGGLAHGPCPVEEQRRTVQAAQRRREIAGLAERVKADEELRLRSTIVLSVAELRRLTPQQFEDEIARMFERLGYSVNQTPYTNDYL